MNRTDSGMRSSARRGQLQSIGAPGHVILTFAVSGIVCLLLPIPGEAQTFVKGWGLHIFDSRFNSEAFVQVAAGYSHTMARRSNGSLVAWGDNYSGECNVPALPAGIT